MGMLRLVCLVNVIHTLWELTVHYNIQFLGTLLN